METKRWRYERHRRQASQGAEGAEGGGVGCGEGRGYPPPHRGRGLPTGGGAVPPPQKNFYF